MLSDSALLGAELHHALAQLPADQALEAVRAMVLERYTWQSCAAESVRLYQELLTKR
jgi:glycosyltransferase involved in cell wall biosynthesis